MPWWIIVVIVVFVVLIGSVISRRGVQGWLFDPSKTQISPYQPAPIVFGIVWLILYTIYALVWIYIGTDNPWVDSIFIFGLLLNLLWTYAFFGLRAMTASRVILILMILLAVYQVALIWKYAPASRVAVLSFGFLIYTAWLVVAFGLNVTTTFL